MSLHDKTSDIAGRKEYIAESHNMSPEEARQLIKSSTFGEYLQLTEANADKGFVGTQTMSNSDSDDEPSMNTPRTPTDASNVNGTNNVSSDTDKEKEFDDALKQFDSPTDQNELKNIKDMQDTDPEEANRRLQDFERRNPMSNLDSIKDFFANATNNFMQGFSKEATKESSELDRIRELAGVNKHED